MNSPSPIFLQLTSLQGKESRSVNALKITFDVIIRNNAARALEAPHNSACDNSLAFPGGMLQLRANGFWGASAVLVPRIAPQASATVRITTRPSVGFKTPNELDVDARFDLFGDTTARTLVPCSGTFATDGAVWQKSVIEFAGDVLHAQPFSAQRSSINVLFVGAVPQSGTSSLINTALTTLSFSKHPLQPAPVGWMQTAQVEGIARVHRYEPGADGEGPDEDDDSTCDVDGDEADCRVRLLDMAENVATAEALCAIVGGQYDIENTCETVEHPGERRCDTVVFVVPAPLLVPLDQFQLLQAIENYQALLRARVNLLIAITMTDLVRNTEEELRTAAKMSFNAHRVFVTRAYRGEEKRCASIEKSVLALLLAATRKF